MGALGVLEVLDRDGLPRQSYTIQRWPVRVGRALDNDLILGDAHVAPHHLAIAPADDGLTLDVADTRNGVVLGRKRWRSGERAVLAETGEPVDFTVGRSALRLHLPGHVLAPEVLLASDSFLRGGLPMLLAALVLIGGTLFGTYLASDPDGYARAAGTTLLSGLVGAAVWCTAWALLSKTFTRQAHFGWHLRVFLGASVALMAIEALVPLLAFMFSWAWLSNFGFIALVAVIATGLYFHLLAVEPARRRALKSAAVVCALVGVLLSMWFNFQRNDQLGDELYMSHLFPPAFRLARPESTDAFVSGLATLKGSLDKKAQEPGRDDDGPREDDE